MWMQGSKSHLIIIRNEYTYIVPYNDNIFNTRRLEEQSTYTPSGYHSKVPGLLKPNSKMIFSFKEIPLIKKKQTKHIIFSNTYLFQPI